jgi:hypothetical protein
MYVNLPDELERRFRQKVAEVYGLRWRSLTKAVIEAIELWLEKHERTGGKRRAAEAG